MMFEYFSCLLEQEPMTIAPTRRKKMRDRQSRKSIFITRRFFAELLPFGPVLDLWMKSARESEGSEVGRGYYARTHGRFAQSCERVSCSLSRRATRALPRAFAHIPPVSRSEFRRIAYKSRKWSAPKTWKISLIDNFRAMIYDRLIL